MWPEMGASKPASVHPIHEFTGELTGSTATITNQPKKDDRKKKDPNAIPDGLEGLLNTQHLFIQQSVFSNLETHYEVLNSDNEKIFMGDETTDTSTKAWCRGTKPFDVSILLRSGMYRKQVLKLDGEPRSCGCGGDITLRSPNSVLGTIEHATEWAGRPHYFVRNAEGESVLEIIGPEYPSCFSFSMDSGTEFEILLSSPQGKKTLVGKIAKYWGNTPGLTKGDIWGVKFPLEMIVTQKALLLAACFLLNFQYQDMN